MATPAVQVLFDDPGGRFDGHRAEMRASLKAAWDLWAQHLDADRTIEISLTPGSGDSGRGVHAIASAGQVFWYPTDRPETADGGIPSRGSVEEELISGTGPTPGSRDATITLYSPMSDMVFPSDNATEVPVDQTDMLNVFTHEIGHILGIADGRFDVGYPRLYETLTEVREQSPFGTQKQFNGPEVRDHVGGPIPLYLSVFGGGSDPAHFDSLDDIMNATPSNENAHVSRADLAVLADLGLPVKESSLTGPIAGSPGVDTVRGTRKDDRLIASKGDDILIGESGTDTVVFPEPRDAYGQVGRTRVTGPTGDDQLDGIERLEFADTTVDLTASGGGGDASGGGIDLLGLSLEQQVSAIYVGYYARAPDPGGLSFWRGELESKANAGADPGVALAGVAESFRQDDEGTATYPFLAPDAAEDASRSEIAGFVGDVYDNLFNRAPQGRAGDPKTGLGYWVDQVAGRLNAGVNIGDIVVDIAAGAQGDDATVLRHHVEVATAFGTTLSQNLYDALADPKGEARGILDNVDTTDTSVTAAKTQIMLLGGNASAQTNDPMTEA